MDIPKSFAKKRGLSDQPNNGDEPKRLREKKVQQAVALQIHLPTYSKKV